MAVDYEINRTLLIELQEVRKKVKLKLKSGEVLIGIPDVIVFESEDPEDDENYNEIPNIRFLPNGQLPARYLEEDDIESYEVIAE